MKTKTIKAWAIKSKITGDLMIDGYSKGRYWIYSQRKLARESVDKEEEIVAIEIKILNKK